MSLLPGFGPTAAEARAAETDTADRQDDPTPRGVIRADEGPTVTHLLPELTAVERQWVVPPGSETPSEDLPSAPGWTP